MEARWIAVVLGAALGLSAGCGRESAPPANSLALRPTDSADAERPLPSPEPPPGKTEALLHAVADPDQPPAQRYLALRQLEGRSPAALREAAQGLLRAQDPFLRLNALAALARQQSPQARAALASLPADERELAQALARRPR